jgi:hypothetical protein
MRAVWAWRLMMLAAVPALALVGMSVATQLPFVLADPGNQDRDGLIAWAIVVALGALALLASVALRRQGRVSAAIVLAAIVALPAIAGVAIAAFIVVLFIIKG